ncbi:MAG TPA: thiamine pyrophosphate-dependent enzyme [Terriglobales bacterium]|jgi:phosphonopyruvate decarboxylase|nr:thiamine pyrophosphate-dependent enzyme [Terriglobales bacterium]
MMKRDEMLKAFARVRKDEIVVAVYMAAQEMTHIAPNDLNYTFVGAMGQGSSHALGLALGRPDRRVVVFDGDGSLLMNLGSLVTIANQAPKNYLHCLCENGCYETNGSVPIPRSGRIRFAEFAKTAGYRRTCEISELAEWERQLPDLLKEEGPIFVDLKVEPGESYPENFRRLYSLEHRERFREALKNS